MQDVETLRAELAAAVDGAGDLAALEELRVGALGKKGRITGLMKSLGQMAPEERREAGQRFNALKNTVTEIIEARKTLLESAGINARVCRVYAGTI